MTVEDFLMPEQNSGDDAFDEWAIVDVMGHKRYVGRVTEQVIAGTGFVRVDIPATAKIQAWTKFIGTKSIYEITPVSEEGPPPKLWLWLDAIVYGLPVR